MLLHVGSFGKLGDMVFRNINPSAESTALSITQHLCSFNRVLHNPGHILKNRHYQTSNNDKNMRTDTLVRQHREKFGITITMHIMEVNNNMSNSDLPFFTNFAFVAMSFSGQCVGTRNYKDPTIGLG